MILYHCPDGRSFRPLWALEELGIPYELRLLPFPPRVMAPEYLAENPLGTIPLLIDGDTRLRESVAICHYLAMRHGPSLAVDAREADFAAYLDALVFGEASLTWPQGVCLLYSLFEREDRRQPQVAEDMRGRVTALLDDTARRLEGRAFVAAGRFTMADISIGYALHLLQYIGLAETMPAVLQDYYRRLAARPAFERALAKQKES